MLLNDNTNYNNSNYNADATDYGWSILVAIHICRCPWLFHWRNTGITTFIRCPSDNTNDYYYYYIGGPFIPDNPIARDTIDYNNAIVGYC